ncbi:SDR family NAD(P)-dependent oxidoreductase [Pseudonocardia nigra]|uniref:SDR family NAD(P)-dependent oxidoreductase n=1 Tax=Pseudonocardia nigra TaxID=1921578 RepID=UPI001C5E6461|nr:SDR family oxidoreductase [Pseudonocardia nigra]
MSTPGTSTRPVAVVTGASRGLGFLLARELADRGHDLVVNARSADGLAVAAADLQGRGTDVVTVPGDVAVEADAQRLVATAQERFGRLDVLVTNAGVIQVGPAAAMRTQDFADAMNAMFWGTVHPTLAALPLLRERGGRILAITSIGGKLPAPHLLPYVAAKHAAVGFAEGLRVEAARHGVSVTVAVPGLMRTGSPRNALFTGDQAAEHRWFTLGDSLPLLSMDAERAAGKLVRAALRGRPEVVLTPAAKLGMRLHGIAPATTMRLLAVANRLLPSDETPRPPRPGHTVARPAGWFDALTALTRSAARRFHQHDDVVPPS